MIVQVGAVHDGLSARTAVAPAFLASRLPSAAER
jgi:hypothetical protein